MSDPIREIGGFKYVYLDYHEEALKAERTMREEAEKEIDLLKEDNNGINFVLRGHILKNEDKIKELEAKLKELEAETNLWIKKFNTLEFKESRTNADLAKANAKIVELERELEVSHMDETNLEKAYFQAKELLSTANKKIEELEKDNKILAEAKADNALRASIRENYELEKELDLVNKKAEKLVEALKPIRKGGYSGASYIVQQAIKEFRGGE